MGWDSSRPVPWKRLAREWVIYATIMAIVFALLFNDRPIGGIVLGLVASGPLYLAIGVVLAKLGYQRTTLKQARANASAAKSAPVTTDAAGPRQRPAPTRRTGGATRPGGRRP